MVVPQGKVTEAIDVVQWAVNGDDDEAAAETRKRSRQCGPAVAFLNFVMRSDGFATSAQRVRAATTLLEVGEFLSSEAKPTGLFCEATEDSDSAGKREVS